MYFLWWSCRNAIAKFFYHLFWINLNLSCCTKKCEKILKGERTAITSTLSMKLMTLQHWHRLFRLVIVIACFITMAHPCIKLLCYVSKHELVQLVVKVKYHMNVIYSRGWTHKTYQHRKQKQFQRTRYTLAKKGLITWGYVHKHV